LIVKSLPNYARFECPNGNSIFSIHQTQTLPKGDGIHVYFECENLDEEVENLRQAELNLRKSNGSRLKDVDGNQLILFYGGENRLNPPCKIETK